MRRDEGHVLKKNVRCTSTRKDMDMKTENQVERLSCKRHGSVGLKEDARDRTKWKNDIKYHSDDPR